jgi:hypothetical protein
MAAGATILGGSYLQNKNLKEQKAERAEDREYNASEKEKDREFQERMLKEKISAEMEAAAAATEEAKKLARFQAMIRAAENQSNQAMAGGQSAARAFSDLAALAQGPLRR